MLPSSYVFAEDDTASSSEIIDAPTSEETETVIDSELRPAIENHPVVVSPVEPVVIQPGLQQSLVPEIDIPEPIVRYAPLKADGDILVTAFQASAQSYLGYIELHNMTSKPVDLSQWQLGLLYGSQELETECAVQLSGFLLAQSDVVFARDDFEIVGPAANLAQRFSTTHCMVSGDQSLEMIEIRNQGSVSERIVISVGDPVSRQSILGDWQRDRTPAGSYSTTYRSGLFSKDFINRTRDIQTSPLHVPVAPDGLVITEVLVSPRDCIVFDESLDCHDYIKLTNTNDADTAIDLSNYILRSGFSSSTTKIPLRGMVAGGDTVVINQAADGSWFNIPANEGTVWLEDSYGLAAPYDMNVASFENPTASKGRSWAYDTNDQTWKWAVPAPYSVENDFTPIISPVVQSSLVPCGSNQYRSEETNRCRNIAVETTFTPCKEGQYRSEETNRCRSIALAAASTLKVCADNQFRNPDTNRCKLIASLDDVVQPCDEGKERNPETNRCRTILATTIPEAAFAVEPMAETGKAFVGWWVLGGVGLLALGYAGWEWRREAISGIRRVRSVLTARK